MDIGEGIALEFKKEIKKLKEQCFKSLDKIAQKYMDYKFSKKGEEAIKDVITITPGLMSDFLVMLFYEILKEYVRIRCEQGKMLDEMFGKTNHGFERI